MRESLCRAAAAGIHNSATIIEYLYKAASEGYGGAFPHYNAALRRISRGISPLCAEHKDIKDVAVLDPTSCLTWNTPPCMWPAHTEVAFVWTNLPVCLLCRTEELGITMKIKIRDGICKKKKKAQICTTACAGRMCMHMYLLFVCVHCRVCVPVCISMCSPI